MNNPDSLVIDSLPFYQWDTSAFELPQHEVNVGIPLDSIFRSFDTLDTIFRQSMFSDHSLALHHHGLLPRPDTFPQIWIFVLLIALCALLCIYFRTHKITPLELLKSTIDRRVMDRLLRDNNLNRTPPLVPMGIFVVATVGLFAHQAAMPHTGLPGYGILAGALLLAYLLRNAILRLLGNIFDNQPAISLYIVNNYLYHLLLASILLFLLFPMVYFDAGRNVFIYIIGALIALEFLIRFVRGSKLFLTQTKNSGIYLFYYLCTVEIVPILVFVHWIITH